MNPSMATMRQSKGTSRRPSSSKSKRLSTTDVIHPTVVDETEFYRTCQTGDILLWCVGSNTTDFWARIIQACGGTATVGRRCPVLHSILIVRDPPSHVLEHYGYTQEKDGNVFALESSSRYKAGAKLSPLKNGEWMQHQLQLDKEIQGIKDPKLLWRRLASAPNNAKHWEVPTSFWDWIVQARSVPYAFTNRDIFNLGLVPGAYAQLSSTLADAIVHQFRISWGCELGYRTNIIASVLERMLMLLIRLALSVHFFGAFLFLWIPMAIADGPGDGKNPPFLRSSNTSIVDALTCSSNTAVSLTKAGILNDSSLHSAYLPIDFLPSGVIGNNLMDKNLNRGFKYNEELQQVVLL